MMAPSAPHHQLQYLEAMGLTVWTARYRLPHAAETTACEWPEASAPKPNTPPSQRLHSLIDEAEPSKAPTVKTPAPEPETVSPAGVREMLSITDTSSSAPAREPMAATKPLQDALSFTMQITALDQRWLIILAQPHAPTDAEQRFLHQVLIAAGIRPNDPLRFLDFEWPMIKGLPVEDPVIEAQQGMRAFLEGRRQAGWVPERLLMFGDHESADWNALASVLQLQDDVPNELTSSLLQLPVWQSEALTSLMSNVEHKRALWPRLQAWTQWWGE